MEGAAGESYPSLSRLVEYTGLNMHTVTDTRKWLRANGWLTSSGQKHTDQGKFSIPIEHTTIPEPVSGKPTNGASGKTAGGKPTNGASGKTASGLTASGKPTTEVDPKDFEVDPAFEVDPKKKEREREVDAAPAATSAAPAAESPKPSLSLVSPAAGLTAPQKDKGSGHEKTKAQQDKENRQSTDIIIQHAKARSKDKASISKTARADLATALIDLGRATIAEVDAAIDAELKQCHADDPTSYVIFGSRLAANIGAFIKNLRVRSAADAKQAEAKRKMEQFRLALEMAEKDVTIDLKKWLDDKGLAPNGWILPEQDALVNRAIQNRQRTSEPPPPPPVPMEIDPDRKDYRIRGILFKAESQAAAIHSASEYFKDPQLNVKAIQSISPAMRPVAAEMQAAVQS
jgi:hypothetical protein